jgi:glucose/arabinose dehydrogenase
LANYLVVGNLGTDSEQGLLSMAFHPNYSSNGYVYVFYAAANNALNVDRYTVSNTDINYADANSKVSILSIPHANQTNHNGGQLNFGPDGYLYLSTGDGGGGGDPYENAQNPQSLLGKILRIDVNTTQNGKNYGIPADNPFQNEVYCLGLRNPFRWCFDRYTSEVYIGDVGQNAKEEVSHSPFNQLKGKNFGWDCYEGSQAYETSGCTSTASSYTAPIYNYPISGQEASVIGGVVYRGYEFPDLQGIYFCSDFYSSNVRKIKNVNGAWQVNIENVGLANFTNFGESESGEVYVVRRNNNNSAVYKLVQANTTAKKVYTFTGNGSYNTVGNWSNGEMPPNAMPSNAVVVIKPIAGGTCTISQTTELNMLPQFIIEEKAKLKINSFLKF